MNKKLEHHSITDWNFNASDWNISTSYFVSPPSSLKLWGPSYHRYVILCKAPCSLQLPQGQIITYVRTPHDPPYPFYLYFRNISPPGIALFANGYEVRIWPEGVYPNAWQVHEWVSGDITRHWYGNKATWPHNSWQRIRVTWWESWGILLVRLELEIAGVWVTQGEDITIENHLFGAETYQRTGIGGYMSGFLQHWYFDDTEIWQPA